MPARILIVEDERITAEDLRDILVELGYQVTASVANGADAIAHAQAAQPDLVLMDIRIQGAIDGTETARILHQRFNIPVVYLTAYADIATVGRAKLAEPLGYVTKPFRQAELHAAVEVALHKHRSDLRLLAQRELLTSTLQSIAKGVISVDCLETVTLLNPAAEMLTGWTTASALGKPLNDVFRLLLGSNGDPGHSPLWRVLSEGSIEELADGLMLEARSGELSIINGSIAPIRDHQSEVCGAVIVFGAAAAPGIPRHDPLAADDKDGLGGFTMIAAAPATQRVLKFARRVAESEVSTILLEGESGTGKDVVARFIHHFGRRKQGPFIALNCAAIPETLLESELFGYEKGAFTDARAQKAGILELATGGTMFLDEVGEMPLVLQAKMLRVLEEQTFRRLGGIKDIHVDVRVVAASNRKLSEAIDQGKFRKDLYYRLNVIQVALPPLRDRLEDIPPLAEFFVRFYNTKFNRSVQGLSSPAVNILMAHAWPGNVRELRNVIERAMVLEETNWIQAANLLIEPKNGKIGAAEVARPADTGFEIGLEQTERNMLSKALEKCAGNQTRAAILLGVTRDTLRYKMKKFNLR